MTDLFSHTPHSADSKVKHIEYINNCWYLLNGTVTVSLNLAIDYKKSRERGTCTHTISG